MKMERDVLLYHLMPFAADEDFDKAITRGVDTTTFKYQNRFNYWISLFEAQFGDILVFAQAIEGSESEKILLINNLIINLITKTQENEQKNSTPSGNQGE